VKILIINVEEGYSGPEEDQRKNAQGGTSFICTEGARQEGSRKVNSKEGEKRKKKMELGRGSTIVIKKKKDWQDARDKLKSIQKVA